MIVPILAVILTAVVIAFVGYPLLEKSSNRFGGKSSRGKETHELLTRLETLYLTMHDLEFDLETGKLSRGDYQQMRARHMKEAVSILQQLDQRMGGRIDELESELEAEISQRRRDRQRKPAASGGA